MLPYMEARNGANNGKGLTHTVRVASNIKAYVDNTINFASKIFVC